MVATTSSALIQLSIGTLVVLQDEIESLGKSQKIGAGLERRNI
jgi:hypothetical protein